MTSAATQADGKARPQAAHGRGGAAAWQAISSNTIRLPVPALGTLTLPSPQSLAFYAGLAVVGAAGLIDWPVIAVLAAGHLLAEDHHHRLLHSFGEALTEA